MAVAVVADGNRACLDAYTECQQARIHNGKEHDMTTTRFSVPAMSCDTCKHAIEIAVAPEAGVARVDVDVAAGTVTVRYDQRVTVERLVDLIEAQGYDVICHRSEATPVRGETL